MTWSTDLVNPTSVNKVLTTLELVCALSASEGKTVIEDECFFMHINKTLCIHFSFP